MEHIVAGLIAGVVSLMISLGTSYLIFRTRFERFEAASEVWVEGWKSWRSEIEKRLERKMERLSLLENTMITREQHEHSIERRHLEHKAAWERIEARIEFNARDGREDREQLLEQIQKIARELAAYTGAANGPLRKV